MSTLKTHNLQSPDAGSVNIIMAPNAGMVVAGLSTYSNQINVGNNIKLGNAGVVTATTFVGNLTGNPTGSGANLTNLPAANLTGTLPAISGANLTSLPTQVTITGNADNRVITGGSGVNLNGEQYLTWNGSTLGLQKSGSGDVAVNIEVGNGISQSRLLFSDSTAVDGTVTYDHNDRKLFLGAGTSSPTDGDITIDSSGKVGINESSPDSLLHLTTNSSTAYSTSEVNTVNATNTLLRLENTNGSDGGGVNNYVGMYFRVGSGANSDAQLQYVRSGDNAGTFHFKARNAGSTYPNLMAIKSDGNTGFNGVIDPKSSIHLGSNQDMRMGGQYGGLSQIMQQVEYAAGYTGTHWMFETNNMISWSFDGVLIVYGGGGSSYGSEVTKITIVYSRESGANNSGDIWRNGTTSYNIETLGHSQVGLNPSAGSLTVVEDTAPDGSGSSRSLFKLGWTTAGHGGATTIWSKLHGTIYWGTGSSGDVEIQDKDGNIFWDSNP